MHAEAPTASLHFAYKESGGKQSMDDKSKFKWIEELQDLHHVQNEPKNSLSI